MLTSGPSWDLELSSWLFGKQLCAFLGRGRVQFLPELRDCGVEHLLTTGSAQRVEPTDTGLMLDHAKIGILCRDLFAVLFDSRNRRRAQLVQAITGLGGLDGNFRDCGNGRWSRRECRQPESTG